MTEKEEIRTFIRDGLKCECRIIGKAGKRMEPMDPLECLKMLLADEWLNVDTMYKVSPFQTIGEFVAEVIAEAESVEYELKPCQKCLQMTNHLKGKCQKCKYRHDLGAARVRQGGKMSKI